jgi:hypothetical protein
MLAAGAACTFWAAATENYGALAGIGLNYLVVLAPISIFCFQLGASTGEPSYAAYGITCALGALFGLAMLLWSLRIPIDRTIPMPRLVFWSFVIFIVALLAVSFGLLLGYPNVIPWSITPELSVVIGWIFLGDAAYFVYGLLRPSWYNAAGQLAAFLAYDLVLIVPLLQRLPVVAPEHRTGLITYTAVLVYSGSLAIYYLFINKSTRVGA